MADQKPQDQVPQSTVPLAEDQPDPNVQAPALVWISKSYKPGKSSSANDATREASSKD